jgi:hypothetical protein
MILLSMSCGGRGGGGCGRIIVRITAENIYVLGNAAIRNSMCLGQAVRSQSLLSDHADKKHS